MSDDLWPGRAAEARRLGIKPVEFSDIRSGVNVRHRKGGEYVIVGLGKLEATWTDAVIYRKIGEDLLIARSLEEFTDGRFEVI